MENTFLIKNKINAANTIKIEVFRKEVRKTIAHKHNKYLELVFFTHASGFHTIDNKKITVNPGTFFVVRKEQIHFWDLDSEPSGYVILLKKEFVNESLDLELKNLIAKTSAITYRNFQEIETFKTIFDLLVAEHNIDSNTVVIEGLLKALLAKIISSDAIVSTKNNSIFSKFMELLDKKEKVSNHVEYYANLLNTTPQNLNNSCKKEEGNTASEVLSNFIITEAKRLLIYTDLTILEISYQLSFKDNSHFSKYFKRHVGLTPKNYRTNHN